MLPVIILILLVLTIFGYIQISIPGLEFLKMTLILINGKAVTFLNVIVLGMILWALGILPTPFREIAGVLLILWVLSILGIIAIVWSSHFVILVMVVVLFLAIVMGR